jgi:SAM-dependent methyltransferase
LWLYLVERPYMITGKAVLHVAPEEVVATCLEPLAGEYVSVDIEPGRAAVQADLMALPFESERFDLIVCSHVLEHVPDDGAAMRELHRVLQPDGVALILTPVNYDQAATYEDPSTTDEADRLARFSQSDHVRVFGRDLRQRLEAAGFTVTVEDAAELGSETVRRYGLQPNASPLRNDIYMCV